jgi:hypothetical protein
MNTIQTEPPEPTSTPQTPPELTHCQYKLSLASAFNGIQIRLLNATTSGEVNVEPINIKVAMDGHLYITVPRSVCMNVNGEFSLTTEAAAEALTAPDNAMRNIGTRVQDETARLIDVHRKMVERARIRIRTDWKREIPDAVINTCMRLGYYTIDGLQWAGDHYFVNINNMYVGIEEDGYAHT